MIERTSRWTFLLLGCATSAVIVSLVLLVGRAEATGDLPRAAAYVIGFDKSPSAYAVLRGANQVPLSFNLALANGDIVRVLEDNASLRLRYVDRSIVVVTKRSSPMRIWAESTEPTVSDNALEVIWNSITRATDLGSKSTSTRGDADAVDVLIPGLVEGAATIARGNRHLELEWVGGAPPFQVTLQNSAGRTVFNRAGLNERSTSPELALEPGAYSIVVADAKSAVRLGFSVAPVIPNRPFVEPASADTMERDTLRCAALVAANPLSYSWESYLCASEAASKGWQPAIALRSWIARGEPN